MFNKLKCVAVGLSLFASSAWSQENFTGGVQILFTGQEQVEQEFEQRGVRFLSQEQIDELVDMHGDLVYMDDSLDFDSPTDCSTNCTHYAEARSQYRYPCPTLRNPGRTCTGINRPVFWPIKHSCDTARAASCQVWDNAVGWLAGRIKGDMISRGFNATKWQAHVAAGTEGEYTASCTGAAVALITTGGALLGGPYAALAAGAFGTFAAYRICEQSTHW